MKSERPVTCQSSASQKGPSANDSVEVYIPDMRRAMPALGMFSLRCCRRVCEHELLDIRAAKYEHYERERFNDCKCDG